MSWIVTAIVGTSVVSGYMAGEASDSATRNANNASAASIAEQKRQFDLTRKDTAPYREAGESALNTMKSLNSGDMSSFKESPGYQFNLEEGQKAIDRSLVARTGGLGGAGVKEGVRFASGMASNEYSNFWNRIASQAGLGQTGVSQSAAAGTNSANAMSNTYMTAGQQRGNASTMAAQGMNNAFQSGVSNYMLYDYLKTPSTGTGSRGSRN